jgi:hypothetical protein
VKAENLTGDFAGEKKRSIRVAARRLEVGHGAAPILDECIGLLSPIEAVRIGVRVIDIATLRAPQA